MNKYEAYLKDRPKRPVYGRVRAQYMENDGSTTYSHLPTESFESSLEHWVHNAFEHNELGHTALLILTQEVTYE